MASWSLKFSWKRRLRVPPPLNSPYKYREDARGPESPHSEKRFPQPELQTHPALMVPAMGRDSSHYQSTQDPSTRSIPSMAFAPLVG